MSQFGSGYALPVEPVVRPLEKSEREKNPETRNQKQSGEKTGKEMTKRQSGNREGAMAQKKKRNYTEAKRVKAR